MIPISEGSNTEGYCSGSDWDSDSTWPSYDSMRDFPTFSTPHSGKFPNFFPLRKLGKEAGDCHSPRCAVSIAAIKTQSMDNKMGNRTKETTEETIKETTLKTTDI